METSKQTQPIDWTRLILVGRGLLIGLCTGAVVSAFRWSIGKMLAATIWVYQQVQTGHGWWWLVIIGGSVLLPLGAGILVKQQPQISGSGIPQVEAQLDDALQLHWWSILWRKFIGGVLSIGPGLFLGREGPSIQLGAAVGQGFAETTGQAGTARRIAIACGAAGGLSAAFNAPIAGTLFVLEEIYHNFSLLVWLASLASAVAANFVASVVFGLTPVLHLTYANSLPLNEYGHLLGLGVLLGLLGVVYQKTLLAMPGWYRRFVPLPRWLDGLVPFAVTILVGFWQPLWLGGGNAIILHMGQVVPTLGLLLVLFAVRFALSMVAYGSGLPGGIFLPILSLGAVLGGIYATVMIMLGWLPRQYFINFVIFAMAGYFAGIGKAPFTAILLITEMVGSLVHLMPLAVVSLVAYLVVDVLHGAPIYASLRDRLKLPAGTQGPTGKRAHIEIPVTVGSRLEDTSVRDFRWPKGTLLVAIRRGEQELVPSGDTLIHAGDTLLVAVDASMRAKVKEELTALVQQRH
ncbi:ClC family H(+)/Cl(-) exchange transporter [Schleiferilactobacillus harbinensis]|uniref:ClC family H(+)/Cl(-) exchange transporter n=3 Tax=Schleiferilactobacillus harbinensis TaxID=304207 RepID=A0A510TUP3_9LACO|nr:ClC family H(+)/Cl(-) exchange transporter [Schleiferilactobacillus harbinensis]KRM29339.1 chloride channel protein [Schleiferilactobacillus harbinensis DSM 16991]MCI1688203.1 ClC family H(+)/Cl(-) exchange transporter [Schleiferilactobacillus harbinensis]MCI1782459.1 ClC family H(+)/Cl(-) exchange transporter [Schleiferilactobacillus harbinensis]MCI1850671.1 ClC family H(+)/Cl(-) exchange transporter [Schleiferilactobacillus harbinensis]MCT2908258.1 ClC family H(+)/Cl(-) exchange transport